MRNVQREPKLLSAVEDKMEKLKRGLLGGMWVVRKNNNNSRQAQPAADHVQYSTTPHRVGGRGRYSYRGQLSSYMRVAPI